ncbi:TetR family transcriptional regulator [Streptomyces boncukensis]|uniref:TetR/AcrR family transcriptional regulator n=1 Tax=Streptomyces boncukensis TaxID=2711219 RepID=A0A6G4X7P9_9ACTN|nr:TetR family transcriptional regulator [Streptomyces boncukensis]NGO72877.1 TetR/AcrR family transcriptional regulator [Streptomyces boncukensis]
MTSGPGHRAAARGAHARLRPGGRSRAGRGSARKRAAILAGALRVFARDGYTCASVSAVAAASGVSTRTVYNHFGDKARLFQRVLQESARKVAEEQVAIIGRHLGELTEAEGGLIAFGRAWAGSATAHPDHFAVVRQISAEACRVPHAALSAWREAGPVRVRREVARRLSGPAGRGLPPLGDPERAALHLLLLVTEPQGSAGALTAEEREELVVAGVRTFLHGYAPAP